VSGLRRNQSAPAMNNWKREKEKGRRGTFQVIEFWGKRSHTTRMDSYQVLALFEGRTEKKS